MSVEKTENEIQLEKAVRVWRQNPTPDNGRILKLMQGRVKREKAEDRRKAKEGKL